MALLKPSMIGKALLLTGVAAGLAAVLQAPPMLLSVTSAQSAEPSVVWVHEFHNPYGVPSAPALSPDGTIYAIGECLFALHLDGTVRWEQAPSEEQTCIGDPVPVVDTDGDVYGRPLDISGSGVPAISAVHSDGKRKWDANVTTFFPGLSSLISISNNERLTYHNSSAYAFEDGRVKFRLNDTLFETAKVNDLQISRSSHTIVRQSGQVNLAGSGWVSDTNEQAFWIYRIQPDGTVSDLTPTFVDHLLTIDPTDEVRESTRISPIITERARYMLTWEGNPDPKTNATRRLLGTHLYAVNDESGEIQWRYSVSGEGPLDGAQTTFEFPGSEPVIGPEGTIYIVTTVLDPSVDDPHWSTLHAINPDGTRKWIFRPPQRVTISGIPAVGGNGTVYVPTETCGLCVDKEADQYRGSLYALDPDNGEAAWQLDVTGGIRSAPALVSDGMLYFSTVGPCKWPEGDYEADCQGRVYALQTTSPGLADSPWPMFRSDPQHTGQVQTVGDDQ